MRSFGIFVIALLLTCCKKSAPTPAPSESSPALDLAIPRKHAESAPSAENKTEFDHYIDSRNAGHPERAQALKELAAQVEADGSAEQELAARNRRELVLPPIAGFKPESVDRKVRLHLVLEKSIVRKGDPPRYRLEMTNVARLPLDYEEFSSGLFVKDASLLDSSVMRFYLTDNRGKKIELVPGLAPDSFQSNRSSASGSAKADLDGRAVNALSHASTHFQIRLFPGETIRSVGDDDSPTDNFRSLFAMQPIDKPGDYKLEVVLDDRPKPLTKFAHDYALRHGKTEAQLDAERVAALKAALGPATSNSVAFRIR